LSTSKALLFVSALLANRSLHRLFFCIAFTFTLVFVCLDSEHKRSGNSTQKIEKIGGNINNSHTKPHEKTDHGLG